MRLQKVEISDNFLILFALSIVGILAIQGKVDPTITATGLLTFAGTAFRTTTKGKPDQVDLS